MTSGSVLEIGFDAPYPVDGPGDDLVIFDVGNRETILITIGGTTVQRTFQPTSETISEGATTLAVNEVRLDLAAFGVTILSSLKLTASSSGSFDADPTAIGAINIADDILDCGSGGINAGCGSLEDVVAINGTVGTDRVLEIGTSDPILVTVIEPSSRLDDGEATRCCIYAWVGEPGPDDVVLVPKGLGPMCFGALSIATKNPRKIWNSIGFISNLGTDNGPGPEPLIADNGIVELLSLPDGLGQPISVTFQGLIEDRCSRGTLPFSVTNGLALRIE